MDEKAVRLVKEHYGHHANNGSSEEALRRRRTGPALPLKRFHNIVKEKLIRRFCSGVERVLDLCCGRGGDIRKWDLAGVSYVKGIDLSDEEIVEAKRRFSEYRPVQDSKLTIDFESSDILGRGIYEDTSAPFDIVTCFFALHYFMVTEEAISNLFLNASNNLKLGGYFVCTCPDGKRVISALAASKDRKRLQTPMLTLVPKWEGSYKCFGTAFMCSITDTVTEGLVDNAGSYEYLVFTTPLKHIAAKHGLRLISNYEDRDLDGLFDKADENSGFKHFYPQFPRSHHSLELASSLNMAFVFQKVAEREDGNKDFTLEDIDAFPVHLPPRPGSSDERGATNKRKTSSIFAESRQETDRDSKKPRANSVDTRDQSEDSVRGHQQQQTSPKEDL